MKQQNTPTRPIHQVKLGSVKAAIWANQTNRNTMRYTVTVQRIYKDRGLWKRSDTYRRDDLLTLAKVLDIAHTWISEQVPPRANNTQRAEGTQRSESGQRWPQAA